MSKYAIKDSSQADFFALRRWSELARRIEFDLKKQIWAAENLCDDHVTWPAVAIPARYTPQHQAWGVALHSAHTGDELGSTAVIAPFAGRIDMARLCQPHSDVNVAGTAARVAEAAELVEGRLHVFPSYETRGESPYDFAVRLRGAEQLFLDVYDCPQLVQAMMTFVTDAIIGDYRLNAGGSDGQFLKTGSQQRISELRAAGAA